MARQNHGPLSRAKGKLGGVVYQQYEGMQIAREYQPVVKNPQSESQVTNRADFKLASQMVALYKEVINVRLSKLSSYTRIKRGSALEALKRIATNGTNDSRVIDFTGAISAINGKSLTEFAAPTVALNGGSIDVTAPTNSVIFGVMVGFDGDEHFVGRKVLQQTSGATPTSFAIPSNFTVVKAMFVYSYALTEEGRAAYSNIVDLNTNLGLYIERLIASGDADVSDIAGINVSE